jgi:hypothetical protein
MSVPKPAALEILFREVFEGMGTDETGTWFVEKRDGIFHSIHALSAAEASNRVDGRISSIGAHVRHLTHYLWTFNEFVRGRNPEDDWEGSWSVQEFTDQSWQDLQSELAEEYRFTRELFARMEAFEAAEHLTSASALVAHTAYHLGAIRAILPLVVSQS